jgi:gas vesicle structural protein
VAGPLGGTGLAALFGMARKSVEKTAPQASVAEVLDRVLDRGIVIDAWLRVSLIGITLIDVDARVVVASISTYVRESDAIAHAAPPLRLAAPAPVIPLARRTRRRAKARRPARPLLTLQCGHGCTFTRRVARRPGTVRCPSDTRQRCPVAVLKAAA